MIGNFQFVFLPLQFEPPVPLPPPPAAPDELQMLKEEVIEVV